MDDLAALLQALNEYDPNGPETEGDATLIIVLPHRILW